MATAEEEETYIVEIDATCLTDMDVDADGNVCLYECGECGQQFTATDFAAHTHDQPTLVGYEEEGGVEGVGESIEELGFDPEQMVIRLPDRRLGRRRHDADDGEDPEGLLNCELCNKTFMQASNYKRHLRVHTGEKPFECPICARPFTQGNNLKAHMRIHSGERPFVCTYCNQSFTQGSNLKKHERSHTGAGNKPEKRFGCATCGCWFVDYSTLKAHIRVHTKERPFVCSVCDARFTQESNLRRHHRTHSGERPFHCVECGKQFSQGNNLKAHMIVHTGEKPLTCPTCGARFSRPAKYQQHYRDIHLAGMKDVEGEGGERDEAAEASAVVAGFSMPSQSTVNQPGRPGILKLNRPGNSAYSNASDHPLTLQRGQQLYEIYYDAQTQTNRYKRVMLQGQGGDRIEQTITGAGDPQGNDEDPEGDEEEEGESLTIITENDTDTDVLVIGNDGQVIGGEGDEGAEGDVAACAVAAEYEISNDAGVAVKREDVVESIRRAHRTHRRINNYNSDFVYE